MENKAARLHRWLALLLTVILIVSLGGDIAEQAEAQTTDNDAEGWVQRWETRWCYACGQDSTFWVMYLRVDSSVHEVQTMCLNSTCGAINGDLPLEDDRHWNNVFWPEEHTFAAQVTEPTCTEGGYTVYTCKCGYSYQGSETQAAGHRFGDWVVEVEPTVEYGGVRHRDCELCGETETEQLPPLKTDPLTKPTSEPTPEPTPESTPEPTSEPRSEPTPEPTPESTPDLRPRPTPAPRPAPGLELSGAYIQGTSEQTFEPERALTRAEAAAMLARLLAQARDEPIQMTGRVFTDVPADAWYAEAVGYLAGQGVVLGRGGRQFAPEEPITRREFAVLAVRFYTAAGGQVTRGTKFGPVDVPETDWAAEEIRIAADMGWFQEDKTDGFSPDGPMTRAEGVVVLNRVLGRRPNHSYIAEHLRQLNTFTDVDPDHWAWYEILEAANNHIAYADE